MGLKSDVFRAISGDCVISDPSCIDNFHNKYSSCISQQNLYIPSNPKNKLPNPFITRYQDPHLYYSEPQAPFLGQNHIISPSYRTPQGYICVGRMVESPSKNNYFGHIPENVLVFENSNCLGDEFAEDFDPRGTPNMPLAEKVSKWIHDIPLSYHKHNNVTVDYFPAVTSYSSSTDNSEVIDFSERDAILELQARRVTRYATRLYVNEEEPVARFSDMQKKKPNEYNIINYNYGVDYDNTFDFYEDSREAEYAIHATL